MGGSGEREKGEDEGKNMRDKGVMPPGSFLYPLYEMLDKTLKTMCI